MSTITCKARALSPIAVALGNDTPSFRRVALLSTAVCIAAALAGCGGGGGGAATPPAPAPAPPSPSASDHFYVAGVIGSTATGHRVVVADTDASRSAAVLSVQVQSSVPMMSTTAYVIDASSPSVTYRGSPLTFFINGGQLWQIDLSPNRLPTSVRVSSLANGCQLQMVAPLDANGLEAWILLTTAGTDGDCATAADNGQVFVRSGSSTATAPTPVPAQTRVQPVYLTGADSALWWMLGIDYAGATPRLVAYGPTLNVVDVAGGSGVRVLNVEGHAAKAPEGTFVRADDMLRRIEATSSALSIGPAQLAFTGASSHVLLEGAAMYFSDADAVYKVDGPAQATLLARPTPGVTSTTLLAKTPAALVLTQPGSGGADVVWTVDKGTGAARSLLQQEQGKNDIWALRGEQLFYFDAPRGGLGSLRSIALDTGAEGRAVSNLLLVGRVLSRVWERGERTEIGSTTSLLACQPLPGSADCRGSTLVQIDLPSLAVTALGSFPGSTAAGWRAHASAAFEGVRGAVVRVHSNSAAGSPTQEDLYVFNPGEANSLKQVSAGTP